MKGPAVRSGIYASAAGGGGFLFGSVACFAVSFFFIILGCPEARGQDCKDAADLATSIAKAWYFFAVPMGTVAGIATYFITRKGSLPLRRIIAENIFARVLVYMLGAGIFLLSLLIAAIAAFITSSRAGVECPAESAYKCSEASTGEIILGILIVAIALTVAIAIVAGVYRLTRKTVVSEELKTA